MATKGQKRSTVEEKEIAHFGTMAEDWWNPKGAMKPLHQMTPTRLSFIKQEICAHFGLDVGSFSALDGLKILDVGCGAGLLCEPLARMGGTITGIDAAPQNIAAAKLHAQQSELQITYLDTTAEALASKKSSQGTFDVVCALELIEHVSDTDLLCESLAKLCKPGGMVFLSTLNRTPKSWLIAIAGAEYITRTLPVGTHDWKKFLRPSELNRLCAAHGLEMRTLRGMRYHPIKGEFSLSADDLDVNYIAALTKKSK